VAVLGVMREYGRYGEIQRRHVIYDEKTAPSSDTSIAAGDTATITVDIAGEVPRQVDHAGLESISGLPSGVVITGISVDKTGKTLSITLKNTTSSSVTVSANSLTLGIISLA